MKILFVSDESLNIKDVLNTVLDPPTTETKFHGFIQETDLKTKYFNTTIGVWADQFNNASLWCEEFCSDEAEIIRNELVLFVYIFENEIHSELKSFCEKLGSGKCIALPLNSEITDYEKLFDMDFDVINLNELGGVIESAVYELIDVSKESNVPNVDVDVDVSTPLSHDHIQDLQVYVNQIKDARDSKTMTNQDKLDLIEAIIKDIQSSE